MHRQLPLPLVSEVVPSFENFTRGSNGLPLNLLTDLAENTANNDTCQVYLWGGTQSGKTHLLTALHRQVLTRRLRSFYVSLRKQTMKSQLLDALDGYDLILIDDVDQVAKQTTWERSLFNLVNFVREQGGKIVFTAGLPPTSEHWSLPDLVSRFSWGPVLRLEALNEADIRGAMMSSAQLRGLKLDIEAVDFLLKRYRRDVGSLLAAIEILDVESLAAGRARITVPFLKRCFVFD